MPYRKSLALSVAMLSCLIATAKNKKKVVLPSDVLQAHTVWVIVDPKAGVDVEEPNANRIARQDVERALAKWGRLSPVTDPSMADLIITVRKGHGKLADATVGGTPINNPPPVIAQRTDTGISGAGRVSPSGYPSSGPYQQPANGPYPQMEVGGADDMFVVYRGDPQHNIPGNPLDSPPVWRYSGKDALASPGVPAVDAFRKLIAEAEKQQANTP